MPRSFRGYKRDKSWRRHQKHDNVNKDGKSGWRVRDFDRGEDCRYRRRQLQEMGLNPSFVEVTEAMSYLHRRWPSADPILSDPTMEPIVSALQVLERGGEVPRSTRRDSGRWEDAKSRDKARAAARRDKAELRMAAP